MVHTISILKVDPCAAAAVLRWKQIEVGNSRQSCVNFAVTYRPMDRRELVAAAAAAMEATTLIETR